MYVLPGSHDKSGLNKTYRDQAPCNNLLTISQQDYRNLSQIKHTTVAQLQPMQ